MRNGILLAEESPDNIMLRFESSSIEEAFLILSQKQGDADVILPHGNNHSQPAAIMPSSVQVVDTETNIITPHLQTAKCMDVNKSPNYEETESDNKKSMFFTTRGRIKALMTKNFVQLFRQPS